MKKLKICFIVLFAITSIIALFSSCDDQEENTNKSFLVGTWKYSFSSSGDSYVLWTFNSDGSGSYYEWDHGEVDGADTFTYVCDENNSKIIFYFKEDGNEVISFTKNSNTSITVYDFFDSIEYWFKQN